MGEEQAALNRKLSDLLGQGRLSLEAQSGMARLAAEQESIKERLLEMIREFGYRSDITGNLNQLVKNMEQAIQEMQERKADRQTIQNQERILSRLLDAQRSLNSQDFSKKRQARTAQDINRRGPAPIQDQNSKKLDRLRKDILEAAKEGYTKEYLDLIQKYFDALLMINQNREFYFDPDHSKN
jgi:vacuolar-type H+-ATPase subunit I/STV1